MPSRRVNRFARGGCDMKAMMLGFAAAIAIAIGAGVLLDNINPGADEQFTASDSVRLN